MKKVCQGGISLSCWFSRRSKPLHVPQYPHMGSWPGWWGWGCDPALGRYAAAGSSNIGPSVVDVYIRHSRAVEPGTCSMQKGKAADLALFIIAGDSPGRAG